MALKRLALGIEYHGADYHGWQRQPCPDGSELPTIQGCIEQALSTIANHPVMVICAGRTDAGVHALEQVVHFETTVERPDTAWVFGTNAHLPPHIRVLWVKTVDADFHARYAAKARHYRYIIHNQPIPSALAHELTTWIREPLDIDPMRLGAAYLIGEHDFSAFRGAGCQSHSPVRCIQGIQIQREAHQVIMDIQANAFLYHMVRNIMGVLIPVGVGKQPPEWVETVLTSRDRTMAGITAPASGLYLTRVLYSG